METSPSPTISVCLFLTKLLAQLRFKKKISEPSSEGYEQYTRALKAASLVNGNPFVINQRELHTSFIEEQEAPLIKVKIEPGQSVEDRHWNHDWSEGSTDLSDDNFDGFHAKKDSKQTAACGSGRQTGSGGPLALKQETKKRRVLTFLIDRILNKFELSELVEGGGQTLELVLEPLGAVVKDVRDLRDDDRLALQFRLTPEIREIVTLEYDSFGRCLGKRDRTGKPSKLQGSKRIDFDYLPLVDNIISERDRKAEEEKGLEDYAELVFFRRTKEILRLTKEFDKINSQIQDQLQKNIERYPEGLKRAIAASERLEAKRVFNFLPLSPDLGKPQGEYKGGLSTNFMMKKTATEKAPPAQTQEVAIEPKEEAEPKGLGRSLQAPTDSAKEEGVVLSDIRNRYQYNSQIQKLAQAHMYNRLLISKGADPNNVPTLDPMPDGIDPEAVVKGMQTAFGTGLTPYNCAASSTGLSAFKQEPGSLLKTESTGPPQIFKLAYYNPALPVQPKKMAEEKPKNTYYHSIRPGDLVAMNDETTFNFCAPSRAELVLAVRQKSLAEGFRAIIPFADRQNKNFTCTIFVCCMSGEQAKRGGIGCPFKVTYVKANNEPVYRLALEARDTQLKHNHPLPIEEAILNSGKQLNAHVNSRQLPLDTQLIQSSSGGLNQIGVFPTTSNLPPPPSNNSSAEQEQQRILKVLFANNKKDKVKAGGKTSKPKASAIPPQESGRKVSNFSDDSFSSSFQGLKPLPERKVATRSAKKAASAQRTADDYSDSSSERKKRKKKREKKKVKQKRKSDSSESYEFTGTWTQTIRTRNQQRKQASPEEPKEGERTSGNNLGAFFGKLQAEGGDDASSSENIIINFD